MRRLLLVLLAMIALAAAWSSGSAWAHPGHERAARSASHDVATHAELVAPSEMDQTGPSKESRRAAGHHVPSAVAYLAGAVTLLVALPHRRRTLALVLVLLLATFAFEGVFHATLHLHHLPHADGLVIGASPTPPASPDHQETAPAGPALTLLAEAPVPYDARVPDVTVAVNQERAPPPSSLP